MPFSQLLTNLIEETTQQSLGFFAAEIWLSGTIVVMLLARLFGIDRWVPTFLIGIIGTLGAAWSCYVQFDAASGLGTSQEFFTGLLVQDMVSVYFRFFLTLFLMLTIALTVLTGIPDQEDGPDFYSLLFGATIGMMLMASANNLLIVFLGVEMASVPSYAMVGFLKGRKVSSEAALKYVIYGAGTAGVMLYGISLVAGVLGTGSMSEMAVRITELTHGTTVGLGHPEVRVLALGILFVMVGLAFKLSLVPFHFWCPDAFEGAAAEVGGFLSVASKAGAFALLIRFCLALSGPTGAEGVMTAFAIALGVVACVTCTFGNLAAYAQTNVKRLLAYSTIAHAGYMLMAVAAMMVLANSASEAGSVDAVSRSIEAVLYYLAVYLFMNLGAFAVVALIRNQTYSEEIDSYRGLATQTPALCICMLVCLFSLIGLPPFGGFFAKLMVFSAVIAAGEVHWSMYVVLAIGGINTVFSLFYYVRILKTMFLESRAADDREVKLGPASLEGSYVLAIAAFVVILGVWPSVMTGLSITARQAGESIFP